MIRLDNLSMVSGFEPVTIETTIQAILDAGTWTQRIQQIRLIPQRHGTEHHGTIYAAVARDLYMPHLAPDFAYIHESSFYETAHFFAAYDAANRLTCQLEFIDYHRPRLDDVFIAHTGRSIKDDQPKAENP